MTYSPNMRCVATFTLDSGELAEVFRKGNRYSLHIGFKDDRPTISNLDSEQMMRVIASYATQSRKVADERRVASYELANAKHPLPISG